MEIKRQSVLFVCLGNICRSPLAEGIFRKLMHDRGIANYFDTDSCGTGDYHIGQQPDVRTRTNAAKNGIILDHRCRQIQEEDLVRFNHILVMDHNNHRNVLSLDGAEAYHSKIRLMRSHDPDCSNVQEIPAVPDPYYGTEADFQEVFEILHRSTAQLLDDLTQTME